MIKVAQIDFVRAVFEHMLYKNDGERYFDNQDIKLFSFYEHLTEDNEVERYVQKYNDLVEKQNKQHEVGFGILSTTDTPSITNIKNGFISPFEFSCSVRCTLANRDQMLGTLYKLIMDLKGRKTDVAQLDSGKLIVVETIKDDVEDFCYIGDIVELEGKTLNELVQERLNEYVAKYIYLDEDLKYLYCSINKKLRLLELSNNNWVDVSEESIDFNEDDIIDYVRHNVYKHNSFEKYKIDMSLDDIKITEPYTLNAEDYVTITFGGSATLVSNQFRLGNDLVSVDISKKLVKTGETNYVFESNVTRLDPMEMPSGLNANDVPSQLKSNFFKINSHTDSISINMQYSFVLDMEIPLLRQWFNYGRYGENNLGENDSITLESITPNIVYEIEEKWCYWGIVESHKFKAKLVDDINVENTESDTMTLSVTFKIQGDND